MTNMPKVTQRKDHKKKLENFKQKLKMSKERQEQGQTMPEYRNIPVWDPNSKIQIFGYEWEIIYNTVAQMQLLAQATNAVMSRNIVNGTIGMDFEKLNPETLQYETMAEEDKAPLKESFETTVLALRKEQEAALKKSTQPEAVTPTEKVAVKPKKQAKVIKM